MARTKATSGFGTTISYDADPIPGTPAPTLLAEVKAVKGPGFKCGEIEATNNDSTAGWKEFIPGLKEGGEVTFSMNYFKTTFATLMTLFGASKSFIITIPDGSKFAFYGFINGIPPEFPTDNVNQAEISIRITGQPTFTAAP